MSQYRTLTTEQEKYLLKASKIIYTTYLSGVDSIYQWRLNSERTFIEKILMNRNYDLYYDADRLNSVKNLLGYIQRKDY
jgi:hypothetical protein